jgi:hypothetical protein
MNTSYARQTFDGPWHQVTHRRRRITGQATCGVMRVFLNPDDDYTAWADTRVTLPGADQPRCPSCFAINAPQQPSDDHTPKE